MLLFQVLMHAGAAKWACCIYSHGKFYSNHLHIIPLKLKSHYFQSQTRCFWFHTLWPFQLLFANLIDFLSRLSFCLRTLCMGMPNTWLMTSHFPFWAPWGIEQTWEKYVLLLHVELAFSPWSLNGVLAHDWKQIFPSLILGMTSA